MLEILKRFFRFCDARERREFYSSIVLGVLAALFSALKLPAIGVMLRALLSGSVTTKAILLSLLFDKFGHNLTFFGFQLRLSNCVCKKWKISARKILKFLQICGKL